MQCYMEGLGAAGGDFGLASFVLLFISRLRVPNFRGLRSRSIYRSPVTNQNDAVYTMFLRTAAIPMVTFFTTEDVS